MFPQAQPAVPIAQPSNVFPQTQPAESLPQHAARSQSHIAALLAQPNVAVTQNQPLPHLTQMAANQYAHAAAQTIAANARFQATQNFGQTAGAEAPHFCQMALSMCPHDKNALRKGPQCALNQSVRALIPPRLSH